MIHNDSINQFIFGTSYTGFLIKTESRDTDKLIHRNK